MSLQNINFNSFQVQVYGTPSEPLFSIKDIMYGVLKYKKISNLRWFKNQIKNDPQNIAAEHGLEMLTEIGLYNVLFLTQQTEGRIFRNIVAQHLRSYRQQQEVENVNLRKQIESQSPNHPCSVYKIYQNDQILYVGRDKSEKQSRVQQHFGKAKIIAQTYQQIDIKLATMDQQEIVVVTENCSYQDCDQIENELIQKLQPPYNQTGNVTNQYCCQHTGCKRKGQTYTTVGWYNKHLQTHN